MKDSFYFKHDLHAREDRKWSKLIRDHGYKAYGLGWAIIERLYEEEGFLPDDESQLVYELRLDPDKDTIKDLHAVLESDLFYKKGGKIGSHSIDRRIAERAKLCKTRAIAGAKGGTSKAIANQLPSQEGRKEGEEGKENNNAFNGVDAPREGVKVMPKPKKTDFDDFRMPWGENKGAFLFNLPTDYCQWLLTNKEQMVAATPGLKEALRFRVKTKKDEARGMSR